MSPMLTIAKREFRSYFDSPLAYVVICLSFLALGLMFVIFQGVVPLFGDHLFTSSDYSARKPDPVVFERVLQRYDTPARDAFFADDLPENVAGAESVGITGHLFTTGVALLAAIEEFSAARS